MYINSKQNFNLLSDTEKERVLFFLNDIFTEDNVSIKFDNDYLSLNEATEYEVKERQETYLNKTILLSIILSIIKD